MNAKLCEFAPCQQPSDNSTVFIFPAPNLSESTNKTKGDTSCDEEEARCVPPKNTHVWCGPSTTKAFRACLMEFIASSSPFVLSKFRCDREDVMCRAA